MCVFALLVSACAASRDAERSAPSPPAAAAPERLAYLSWMVGSWQGESQGVAMEEHWLAPRGGIMLGLHRDVFPSGKVFFEYLRIEADESGAVLQASPMGRAPTPFRQVESGERRVSFANPEHDFPQRITYWREGGRTLCATVEGRVRGELRSSRWCWNRRR